MEYVSLYAHDLSPLLPYLPHLGPLDPGQTDLIAIQSRLFPIMRHALDRLPKANENGEVLLDKRVLRQCRNIMQLSRILERAAKERFGKPFPTGPSDNLFALSTITFSPSAWSIKKEENGPEDKSKWQSSPSQIYDKLVRYMNGKHRIKDASMEWFLEGVAGAERSLADVRVYRFTKQDVKKIKWQRHLLDDPSVIKAKKAAERYANERATLTRMPRQGSNSTVRIKSNFDLQTDDGQSIKTTPELARKSEDAKVACQDAFDKIVKYIQILAERKRLISSHQFHELSPYFNDKQFLRLIKSKVDSNAYTKITSLVNIYVNHRKKYNDLLFFYKERIESPDGALAYFKQDAADSNSTGIMELLIYRLSRYFDLSHLFTPTLLVNLRTSVGNLHSGSVQPAIQGTPLAAFKEKEVQELRNVDNLLEAFFATIVFCPWDLTPHNLFLKDSNDGKTKKVVFFDNARSLPPSNYFLQWNHKSTNLLTSFRSSILQLPQSHAPLQQEHYEALKRHVANFKEKFSTIEEFFDYPPIRELIDGLPPGWFPKKAILTAMESRIVALEEALEEPGKHQTLLDLTCAIFPSFRIFLGFALIRFFVTGDILSVLVKRFLEDDEKLKLVLAKVSPHLNFMDKLLGICFRANIPPKKILKVCRDLSIPPLEMARRVLGIYLEYTEDHPNQMREYDEGLVQKMILKLQRDDTYWDFKDVPHSLCITGFNKAIEEEFNKFQRPLYRNLSDALNKLKYHNITAFQAISEREELANLSIFAKQKNGQIISYRLDYVTYPGKFYVPEVHEKPLGLKEILKKIGDHAKKSDALSPNLYISSHSRSGVHSESTDEFFP